MAMVMGASREVREGVVRGVWDYSMS